MGKQIDYFLTGDRKKWRVFHRAFLSQRLGEGLQSDPGARAGIMTVLRDGSPNESGKIDIEERIKSAMEKDCKPKWEIVDEISKTKRGKYLHAQFLLKE